MATGNWNYFRAPVDEITRWDDKDNSWGDVPILESQDDQYELVFHNAYWLLLQERFQGRPVPLDRLIEVLNSVPLIEVSPWDFIPFENRDSDFDNNFYINLLEQLYMWENGYNGLVHVDRGPLSMGKSKLAAHSILSMAQTFIFNPYTVKSMQESFDRASLLPPAFSVFIRNRRKRPYKQLSKSIQKDKSLQNVKYNGCFPQFSYEIVEEIASHLPMHSALNLWLAS